MITTTRQRRATRPCLLTFILLAFVPTPLCAVAHAARRAPAQEQKPPARQEKARKRPFFKRALRGFWRFLACETAQRGKDWELRKKGPQFPDSYDPSDFFIIARLKGDEPVVLVHELEPGSKLVVTVKMLNAPTYVQEFPYDTIGPQQKSQIDSFTIPLSFGMSWHAGVIEFRAVKGSPTAAEPAEYRLGAIGIGHKALHPRRPQPPPSPAPSPTPETMGLSRPAPSDSGRGLFAAASYARSAPVAPAFEQDTVSIFNLRVEKVTRNNVPLFSYSFETSRDFGSWKTYVDREHIGSGTSGRPAREMKYYTHIDGDGRLRTINSPIPARWDGKNEEGQRAPRGKYQFTIFAWNSAQDSGEAAARSRVPAVIDW